MTGNLETIDLAARAAIRALRIKIPNHFVQNPATITFQHNDALLSK
jgi:hypothetical protein